MWWRRGVLLGGMAALVAGCNLSSDIPPTRPIGVVRMVVKGNSENGFTTSPTASFLRVQSVVGLPNSLAAPDSCVDSVYTIPSTDQPLVGNIGAGGTVAVKSDLGTGSLTPVSVAGGTSYTLAGAPPIPLTPGKPITFTTAGEQDGFPAMTLAAETVTPFTLGSIDPAPENQLHLSWGPVQSDSAAVVISLQYSSSPTASTADRQIYCAVVDDGSFIVSRTLAEKWRNSSPDARRATAYRWRTTFQVENNGVFIGIAQYDAPVKTTFP